MKKTLRVVPVILSLFAIITLTYQSAWADLPEGRDRSALGGLDLSNWTAMEENPAPDEGVEARHAVPLPLATEESPALDEGEKNEIVKQLGTLPAFFIENQGQTAGEARYYFKGSDTVYFTNEAVVFQKTGDRGQGIGDREADDNPVAAGFSLRGMDAKSDAQIDPQSSPSLAPPSLEGRGKGEGGWRERTPPKPACPVS